MCIINSSHIYHNRVQAVAYGISFRYVPFAKANLKGLLSEGIQL